MGTALAIINIVGAVGRAIGSGIAHQEKKQQLRDSIEQMDKVYNLKVSNMTDEVNEANKYLQTQIDQTKAMQEEAVKQSGSSLSMQAQAMQAQMAELQIKGSQEEGSAIQGAATSGFRGDMEGSIGTAVRETRRATDRAVKLAGLQARSQTMQGYFSARNSYTSAENQKALYKERQTMNSNQLTRDLDELRTQYEYDRQQLKDELDYSESFWGETLAWLGIGVDLGTSVINAGSDAGWWNKSGGGGSKGIDPTRSQAVVDSNKGFRDADR